MPRSDIVAFAAAAARKQAESRKGLDPEMKRAAFKPVQRKDFSKPTTARKELSKTVRENTLANYKENEAIEPAKPVTRFDSTIHKAPMTKDIDVRPNYAAVDVQPKGGKIFSERQGRDPADYVEAQAGCGPVGPAIIGLSAFESDDGPTIMPVGKHSRYTDFGGFVAGQAGCGTEGPAILGPAEFDADEGATIMPVGKHTLYTDLGGFVADQAGCGTEGPAILGPAEFNAEEGATIMPEGKHSRYTDFGGFVADQAGCGTVGPAILGPAVGNDSPKARILPKGLHSRMSDVHSYIRAQAGCGPNSPSSRLRQERLDRIAAANREMARQEAEVARLAAEAAAIRAAELAEEERLAAEAAAEFAAAEAEAARLAAEEAAHRSMLKPPAHLRLPTDAFHTAPPAPQPKKKRFTIKNIRRWFFLGQVRACKFTPEDFYAAF